MAITPEALERYWAANPQALQQAVASNPSAFSDGLLSGNNVTSAVQPGATVVPTTGGMLSAPATNPVTQDYTSIWQEGDVVPAFSGQFDDAGPINTETFESVVAPAQDFSISDELLEQHWRDNPAALDQAFKANPLAFATKGLQDSFGTYQGKADEVNEQSTLRGMLAGEDFAYVPEGRVQGVLTGGAFLPESMTTQRQQSENILDTLEEAGVPRYKVINGQRVYLNTGFQQSHDGYIVNPPKGAPVGEYSVVGQKEQGSKEFLTGTLLPIMATLAAPGIGTSLGLGAASSAALGSMASQYIATGEIDPVQALTAAATAGIADKAGLANWSPTGVETADAAIRGAATSALSQAPSGKIDPSQLAIAGGIGALAQLGKPQGMLASQDELQEIVPQGTRIEAETLVPGSTAPQQTLEEIIPQGTRITPETLYPPLEEIVPQGTRITPDMPQPPAPQYAVETPSGEDILIQRTGTGEGGAWQEGDPIQYKFTGTPSDAEYMRQRGYDVSQDSAGTFGEDITYTARATQTGTPGTIMNQVNTDILMGDTSITDQLAADIEARPVTTTQQQVPMEELIPTEQTVQQQLSELRDTSTTQQQPGGGGAGGGGGVTGDVSATTPTEQFTNQFNADFSATVDTPAITQSLINMGLSATQAAQIAAAITNTQTPTEVATDITSEATGLESVFDTDDTTADTVTDVAPTNPATGAVGDVVDAVSDIVGGTDGDLVGDIVGDLLDGIGTEGSGGGTDIGTGTGDGAGSGTGTGDGTGDGNGDGTGDGTGTGMGSGATRLANAIKFEPFMASIDFFVPLLQRLNIPVKDFVAALLANKDK